MVSKRVMIAVTFALGMLGMPRPASASFRRLFKGPEAEVPANNFWDCAPHVRKAIKDVDSKWGHFQFTCFSGTVMRIFVPAESPINSKTGDFLTSSQSLFELEKSSFKTVNEKDWAIVIDGQELHSKIEKFLIPGVIPQDGEGSKPASSSKTAEMYAVIFIPGPLDRPGESFPSWITAHPREE